MSKKQIRVTQSEIRKMINEAIRSYSFNGEGFNDEPDDKFDIHGNKKYHDNVFSTDSEEGEAFRKRAKNYEKPKDGDALVWNQRERKLKDAVDNVSGAKWADTIDSLWDTDRKLDKMARDEFGNEEEESQRYEKPFGDMDDVENQWEDEPGYEENDDDDIAGINEGKISLSEEGLRKLVSYSVAKLLKEANLGITSHFDGESSFKPENPYEGMTWDEYCEAKRKEREEDNKPKEEPSRTNRGIMAHFDGKKHEETPEEKERNEHMFDDDYWVNKMNLSKDELSEIVKKTVKRIMEEIGAGNEEAQVVDNFPKKASGTFTMRTRRGNVDKYKVYVEKTEEEELLTDIFVYDERGKEWEPQAEYVVGIEEYTNGSWLPYWETFNGDVSIRALANCFDKVVKLWKKVGYLYDEDDEIPFRYSGDYMKGAPKGMF